MKVTEIEICEIPQEQGQALGAAMRKEIAGATNAAEASGQGKPSAKEDDAKKPAKPESHNAGAAEKHAARKGEKEQAREDKLKAKGASLAKKVAFERDAWAGYSYNELRLQTLLMRTRIDLNKSMMMSRGQTLMQKKSRPVTMIGRMIGALDYLDYGVLAYKLGRTIFKLFRR